MGPIEIICGLVALTYLIYYLFFSSLSFWKNRGVKGPKPIPFFGNFLHIFLFKTSINEYLKKVYDEFPDEKLVGVYARNSPILVVKDPDLIKDVLIKDFSNFIDRGLPVYDKVEPLSQHLFGLEPRRWRPLRVKLSPVFTSGKLKEMFYIINECCDNLNDYLGTLVTKDEVIEIREVTAKYTTDVIGSCAFGLKMNAMADENSEFRKMGRRVFSKNLLKLIKFRVRDALPKVYTLLGSFFYDKTMNEFFINSIKQTIEHREKENIVRHDFVDKLREMKNNPNKLGEDIEMTDSLLAAQAFVFFIAGFETSSSTISHMLYEMAQHHTIRDKVREEIMEQLEKNNGDLTYDSIKNMTYMHQVFQETLRKYPVVPTLMRKSAAPYTFNGTNVTIPGKQKIWIPSYAIHFDPKIYPDPEIFDPERFNEENVKSRHPMYHLPFGDGPRNCVGERFAVYQVKTGLSKILENYEVDICDKTVIPYEQDPAAFILAPKGGIYLKFSKLDKSKIK